MDLEKSSAFYSLALDFREGFRMYDEAGTLTTIYLHIYGGQFLELQQAPAGEGVSVEGVHMAYEVDDIAGLAVSLKSRGIPLQREIVKGKSGCLQTWLKDPDGYRIELMQVLPDSLQGQARKRLGGV